MKFKLTLLAESLGSKTVCIHATSENPWQSSMETTRVSRMFLTDQVSQTTIMVTVVIRGMDLPSGLVTQLANRFLAERAGRQRASSIRVNVEELAAG